jgi:flagellar biosynthetic protein FliQ
MDETQKRRALRSASNYSAISFALRGLSARHSWKGAVMTLDQATDLVRQTLLLTLIIAAPMLLIGMVVGIIVSLFQAVTQIQEQTLTFVPKITAMFAAAIILMPWVSQRLIDYAVAMFGGGHMP